MEKRALIAIVLSVAVLVAWQFLFSPPTPPPDAPPAAGGKAPAAPPPAPGAPAPGAPTPPGAVARPAAPVATPGTGGRTAEVTTPLYRASFGADGAVTAWVLGYRGEKPLVPGPAPLGPLAVAVSRPGRPPEVVRLAPERERVELARGQAPATLVFSGATTDGVRLEKRLTFAADTYRVEIELGAAGSVGAGPTTVVLYWTSPVAVPGATKDAAWVTLGETADRRQLLGRILVARNGRPEAFEHPSPALKEGGELKDPHLVPLAEVPPPPHWVALEDDYFMAALIPTTGARALRGRERDLAQVALVFPDVRVDQGRGWEGRAALYVGPKEWDLLSAQKVGLEQAQARNYGDFLWTLPMEWFCVPLLWLMNVFATRLPGQNYGLAIILLTVLVKIVFFPLTQKSMSSMKQMQALQPQLNALRSKYKADPQRFQREQMELFRQHRVNPMGGCLPMVVQVPVFYALYLTIQYSVELQGAPLGLWIRDLSKMDPYYVLPILMGASMLIQQMMTPTVGDPRQARVMLIMPVVFTFMFLQFPTGLVLYWLVNNLLSIGQQYLIDRSIARGRAGAGPAEEKPERENRKA
jgi:YidC/Oxa1 family membrane protein insertase